jgi:hypothetical protein
MREFAVFLLTCMVLIALACAPAQQPGVILVPPEGTSHLPGPMPDFGPFATYSDALLAACPKILSYDNAVVTRPVSPRLRFARSIPKEYCAWIYFTPEGLYEMSLVAMNPNQKQIRCKLPDHVLDPRYTSESLGYVFAVHNHPLGSELSLDDIGFIVEEARIHGLTVRAHGKEVDLGIAAFFSQSHTGEAPDCDGFYLYFPRTGELLKWTRNSQQGWVKKQYGRVTLREKPTPPGFELKIERLAE